MAEQPDLITLTNPRNPAAEAYRTLRTNLTFAALDKPIETLVVTSAAPDEGSSIVLANLAVTMAQGERRTILVDADLRRPGLHEIFGVANDWGLTTMIVEEAALDDPPLMEVGIDNLWLASNSQHCSIGTQGFCSYPCYKRIAEKHDLWKPWEERGK